MRLKIILTVAAFLSASSPVFAQLDDIIDGIGFGKDKDPIEYRERPPLVVPPSYNLRPPEQKSPSARAANWPNDPDLARRKAKEADGRKPRASSSDYDRGGNKLSVEELRSGRVAGAGAPSSQFDPTKPDSRGWLNPDVVAAQGKAFIGMQEPALKPGEEPKRKFLTDPPKGIRAAAGNAPLVATKDKSGPALDEESSPYSFLTPKKTEE